MPETARVLYDEETGLFCVATDCGETRPGLSKAEAHGLANVVGAPGEGERQRVVDFIDRGAHIRERLGLGQVQWVRPVWLGHARRGARTRRR